MEITSPQQLHELAKHVAKDWTAGPYYDEAEQGMEHYWSTEVWPFVAECNFDVTMDLAAGHGRNTARLLPLAKKVYLVDINQENIDFCRARFGEEPKITYLLTKGFELTGIEPGALTFAYCYDAMVHFDSNIVRSYLREICRVLQPGGKGFCHHSNYTANPAGDVHDNPGWRNYMSQSLFAHYCHKEGLRILKQQLVRENDCITVFAKP